MDEHEEYIGDVLLQKADQKIKKSILKLLLKVLVACAPFLFILFFTLFIWSGIFSALSAFAGLANAIFGSSDTQTLIAAGNMEDLTLDKLIDLVEGNELDDSFYNLMMIDRNEFLYLLKSVQEYNTAHVKRDIYIQAKHVYKEWEESDDEESGGHYVTKTSYEYLTIEVDSADIEKFEIDWQLVYTLCISNMMKDTSGWQRLQNEDGTDYVVHYAADHSRIDEVIDHLSMKYEYLYDLARSRKTYYTMDECQAMVYTPYQSGDPDTEEGEWTYYIPHSVLSSAYSGYSYMFYLKSEQKLTNLITLSDMERFDQTAGRFSYNYNFGYITTLLGFLPGGKRIQDTLNLYNLNRESGYVIQDIALSDYIVGNDADMEALPTGTERLPTDFGDIGYEDIEYDGSIGGKIVHAARTKIGCAYSQINRWDEGTYDCSSFVWRVLGEVGINLNDFCGGSSAAAICEGMVNAGMTINPADIQPGDIIFYSYEINGRYRNVSHTAIYAGNGKMIHARGVSYGVCESSYSTRSIVCICRPY